MLRIKHDVNQPAYKLKGKASTRDCVQTATDSLAAGASLGIQQCDTTKPVWHPLPLTLYRFAYTGRFFAQRSSKAHMKLMRFPCGTILSKLRRLALSSIVPLPSFENITSSFEVKKDFLSSLVYLLSL
jgi:hypothetical protein